MPNTPQLFSDRDLLAAYKKLKHYYYHDNTSLYVRQKIAAFEASIDAGADFEAAFLNKMAELAKMISSISLQEFKGTLAQSLGYRITPKSFKKKRTNIITNFHGDASSKLTRVNFVIDADIIIHLIAVLWLMKTGHILSPKVDNANYAYQLELERDEEDDEDLIRPVVNGLRLYKPYYVQYQKWRDEAIEEVKRLIDNKKNAVMVSLDIKDFYHSVKINLGELERQVLADRTPDDQPKQIQRLFALMQLIHSEYTQKLSMIKKLPVCAEGETILPIGLLSSGLLSNIYLSEFDKKIKDQLNPSYYGRYVDDLLFVFSGLKVDHDAVYPVNDFLIKYFAERDLFDYNLSHFRENYPRWIKEVRLPNNQIRLVYENPSIDGLNEIELCRLLHEAKEMQFSLVGKPELIIQSTKVMLQYLDHKESPAAINKFKKNLEENRSEYRFLPDEDEVDSEFDEEAFSLQYNDSINKLRSIKEFSEDKYGASKYLANKIFASSFSDERPDQKTTKQILTFFKGEVGLAFYTLWEKVATYFIINGQVKDLFRFYRQTNSAIDHIDSSNYEETEHVNRIGTDIKRDLAYYLYLSIATPLAMNPDLLTDARLKEFKFGYSYAAVKITAAEIRQANMFRHFILPVPAINYTRYAMKNGNSLIKIDLDQLEEGDLELDKRLQLLAPRHVHFHDINILEIYRTIGRIKTYEDARAIERIHRVAFDKYWEINNHWKFLSDDYYEKIKDRRRSYFVDDFDTVISEENTKKHFSHEINRAMNLQVFDEQPNAEINKYVAIANIKVERDNMFKSILSTPNTSSERRQKLFKLINQVEKERCDLFVLPETSVPYRWLNLMAYQSQRRNIAIIAGLEHWVNKHKVAFNFVATILPIQKKNYRTSLIKIRLKNYYSHEEKHILKGFRLIIPSEEPGNGHKKYDLFHWRKVYFSVYNCFELANIEDRALFKGKVDFIVASEFNQDTNYFSDIGGSWVRDIHSFFIQVNSSEFGDSRIIQP